MKLKNKSSFNRFNYIKLLILIILLMIYYLITNDFKLNYNTKQNTNLYDNIYNNYTNSYNINKNSIKDAEFIKYKNMLPNLFPDSHYAPTSLKEIFNAPQLYISDVKITRDYIRYIRPINESEEQKYNKKLSDNDTIIDINLFNKRKDQFDYIKFVNLALNEKLIDTNIKYDNIPIISIVLPSYNKQDILLKSIRSIQNQNLKNIEIIIVNDCSTDNSSLIFNYLLKTDPRVRIFHHTTNLGLFRSRLDGILYSRGKYIIAFDTGDFYEDNYVLLDTLNVIEKYNLDSCKFLYRIITNFTDLTNSYVDLHVGPNAKVVYEPKNIKSLNTKVFKITGNIWNRLVRANIYIKALLLFSDLILNVYKNMWEDVWYNDIINNVSNSYAIFERVGYVYFFDGKGVGTPKFKTHQQKNNLIKEYVAFLYFDYNFCLNQICKSSIIKKLRFYNQTNDILNLKYFKSHFEVLNNLLKGLINDQDIKDGDKKYCQQLLYESKKRENLNDKYIIKNITR